VVDPGEEVRFAPDSPLEGEGFEPSVPREGNYARERPRLVCGAAGRGRAARRWRDWQREGGGLAGTGLRDTTQIAPAEHRRDGLELNGLAARRRRSCRYRFARYHTDRARRAPAGWPGIEWAWVPHSLLRRGRKDRRGKSKVGKIGQDGNRLSVSGCRQCVR
jgi:hypothetical protein